MRTALLVLSCGILSVSLGCGGTAGDDKSYAPGAEDESGDAGDEGEDDSGEEETSSNGDEGEDTDEESEGGEPPKLDVPDSNDDGEEETGCSKVDFLFVIDNSVSMAEKQDSLINSFPGFIDVIESTLAAQDYHILVTDTDPATRCTPQGCGNDNDHFAQCLCPGEDNGNACQAQYDECDNTRGAGVVRPLGRNASNTECAIEGDQRYLVKGQSDLSETFACMARVGEAGKGKEKPMDSMVAALESDINGPGGCNEGFFRDDAILVITFISDDPNFEDTGTPEEWTQAVLDAKGGNDEAVVVLGLIPEFGVCEIENIQACNIGGWGNDDPQSGVHWREFVESFGERGLWAHVCEEDYSPFFADAVGVIDETCDNFDPEG